MAGEVVTLTAAVLVGVAFALGALGALCGNVAVMVAGLPSALATIALVMQAESHRNQR